MAKKAVATFKAGTLKKMVKCIRMDKSPKTGAYVFTEQLVECTGLEGCDCFLCHF